VDEFTIKDVAGVPPKETAEAPVKFVPVIITDIPFPALVGANDVMEVVVAYDKVTIPFPELELTAFAWLVPIL
jgi:hypothetical protein